MMEIIKTLDYVSPSKSCVAIGCFDGVHLAHREIIQRVVNASSEDIIPVAVTFTSTMSVKNTDQLMTEEQKLEHLENLGIKTVYHLDFAKIKNLSPADFVEQILRDVCRAEKVFVGYNFHFGKGGAATADDLCSICQQNEIACEIVPEYLYGGLPVSSTRIRSLIEAGRIEEANTLSGHSFTVTAPVVHGRKLGRTIGIPTINQIPQNGVIVPKSGVYASNVTIDGIKYTGVTNIGFKPTVEGQYKTIETWIQNFSGNLYGKTVKTELIAYLREEQKFSSLDELKAQIMKDSQMAVKYFIK